MNHLKLVPFVPAWISQLFRASRQRNAIFVVGSWLALAIWLSSPARAEGAAGSAQTLSRGTDLLNSWEADQHLYVKGDVGIDRRGLADLEAWLDKNGANWSVLLMDHANGEVYRDSDGINHSGADAVEYAVGRGLPSLGGFVAMQDARTGQGNGAALVILLRERKFFYTGSETHDRRGLGQQNWRGELDRPAFRAMSDGRRLVDAVKGTVTEIASRLTRRLHNEQAERERLMRLAQQRLDQAGRVVSEIPGEIDLLEQELAAFRERHPQADGDLTTPDIRLLRSDQKAAQLALAAQAPSEALNLAEPVAKLVSAHRRAIASYESAAGEFESLNAEIGEVDPGREGWGADRLELARQELSEAQEAHRAGESRYLEHLENSREALRSAREELHRAAEQLRAEMARDEELLQRGARARKRAWAIIKLVAGLLALALGGLGYFLNRRRRIPMAESQRLVASWESGFEDRTEELFALLDRTTVVVGSEIELPKRGYTGETLRLSKQTIEDVDQLFIMSSTVARLLREARAEIYPKYGFQRIYNRFATSRYRRAMSKLRDELITFSPEDGVDLLSREEMRSGKPETLLGSLESYQPFALSFPKLMEEMNRRALRATGALDLIEDSWASITGVLDRVRLRINAAGEFELEVAAGSAGDGLFPLGNVFGVLVPSGAADLDAAVVQAATDPVSALAGLLPSAERKADEASALCELVLEGRRDRLPAMQEEMRKLETDGHGTAWVGRFLGEFSSRAEGIASEAAERPAAEQIAALGADLEKLEKACVRARELAARLRGTAGNEIGAVRAAVANAREEIGTALGLAAESVLRERGLDPDVLMCEADELQAAASLAIDRGGVDAAESALDEVAALMKEGLDLVGMTRASFDGHTDEAERRERETQSLTAAVSQHREILDSLKSNYEESALELCAGDPSYPKSGESVIDHIVKVERDLAAVHGRLAEAQEAYRSACLIEASSLLAHIADLQHRVSGLFGEVREREQRIAKMEQSNALLLGQLDDESASIETVVSDHRTMRPTISAFEAAGRDLESARMRVSLKPGDPFEAGEQLDEVRSQLGAVRDMAQSDRDVFDELARSLQEASSHLTKAKDVSQRAVEDQIPDSRRIGELRESIERLILGQVRCERALKVSHGDWVALDREVDEIASDAARATAEMRGELEKAEAAVAAISSAAGSVREAGGWAGSFGVSIGGSPGANRLRQARGALMNGRYLKAQRYADDAGRAARQAVVEARNEEDRKRRAAARKAAEARRRRQSSSGSSFSFGGSSSSSSFGGGRSSGSGGRSSGMGGSSFRSGGSGMGSSGW